MVTVRGDGNELRAQPGNAECVAQKKIRRAGATISTWRGISSRPHRLTGERPPFLRNQNCEWNPSPGFLRKPPSARCSGRRGSGRTLFPRSQPYGHPGQPLPGKSGEKSSRVTVQLPWAPPPSGPCPQKTRAKAPRRCRGRKDGRRGGPGPHRRSWGILGRGRGALPLGRPPLPGGPKK
jgi:hypothetical protein